jgi:hypothetical protein
MEYRSKPNKSIKYAPSELDALFVLSRFGERI